jgi:Carboxypeptidase regulatory-like domain/TonB dependent receptor
MARIQSIMKIAFCALALAVFCWASITGSISGVVTDPSGAVVSGATVVATNVQTGITNTVVTDDKGFYNFQSLPIGTYTIGVSQTGFKTYSKTDLVVDANSALRADAVLQLGAASEKVEVTSDTVHVETENTQMGEVITGKNMTAVPLNGRSYTDLLSLQPGVVPAAYGAQNRGAAGIDDRPVAGGLNAGNQSVNGQREAANGFMVNGSNVEEGKNNGTSVIPNLDSIGEFRIITNNFDAEYGAYSGGQVNVVTKSGTNSFHGDAFEFLRNTALDAKNYFASPSEATPVFRQNQFGGIFGGPIRKDKTFFFVDYQGTRQAQAPTQNEQMPSLANRAGNFSDSATSFVTTDDQGNVVPTTVDGDYWASVLQARLQASNPGQQVVSGEPYFFPGCSATGANACVFPNAIIPQSAWSPAASPMLAFIPNPNAANNFFVTSALARNLRDDKGGVRIDQNTRFGMLFGYYFLDDYLLNDPYPAGGATVPGFSASNAGRSQLMNLGTTKNFGANAVNEFRFSYVRNATHFYIPQGGLGHTLASLGFTPGWNAATGGISPIAPELEGVPYTTFNHFAIGVPQVTTRQYNNSFQWLDNFSKVVGRHTLKFGGQFHYVQINERNLAAENGQYGFSGRETGVDFADFLLGAPDSLTQASPQILDSRTRYYGLYAQDSWRATANLVLNYGLRWEASLPWYDTQNKIETIKPGVQSVVFPGAPTGWVVPGDPGIPRTLAPTKWNAFSPRLGFAYSPSSASGVLGKLFGGPGRTSIRAGFGLYYTSVEDQGLFLEVGDPPYGFYYGSPAPPLFESPYIDRATGNSQGQRFPFVFPSTNVSAKNPNTTFDWQQVEPISFGFSFDPRNRLPYSEHYEFSIQRQIGSKTVVSTSYVGNQGHRLITSVEANPANPAVCLVTPGCGPGSETGLPGVRPLGVLFGSNPFTSEIANSSYNSLQLSASHNTGSLNFLVGYTYSKCMDNSSLLQEGTNPFDPRKSIGLCGFDVTHNFVVSYNWLMPFDRWVSSGWARKLVGGWSLSGITTFATGLPVTLSENDDQSLIGADAVPVDVPNFDGGSVLADTNPRHGNAYFNTALFRPEALGQLGNSRRRFFHGPGLNNFDMALSKTTKITESKELQLRFEAFNIFNHPQFENPDGTIDDGLPQDGGTFGLVTAARDPRIMQIGAKFIF